jgi:hypothetical protein
MDDEALERLILDGGAEFAGLSEDGEMLYSFTAALAHIDPVLYDEMITIQRKEMLVLWIRGFLDMDVTDENSMVNITEKALDESEVNKLPPHFRSMVREIVKAISAGNKD